MEERTGEKRNMRMIDAKKEIEDKLFQGAPLSFDAMMCALAAINVYIEQHGGTSSIALEIGISDEAHNAAVGKPNEEMQKELDSSGQDRWIDLDNVRLHIGFDKENCFYG
jgi:hypothetical protein